MKRLLRRMTGVVLGVASGWWVAGVAPQLLPEVSFAVDTDQARELVDHVTGDHHGGGPADALVPKPSDAPWFNPVLVAIVCLFGASLLLGSLALKLRGPDPPEPQDDDRDQTHP